MAARTYLRAIAMRLLLAGSVVAGACGGGSAPSVSCSNDDPDSCLQPPGPSFAAEVMPLLRDRCGACHTAGGVEATHPFDTYEEVQSQRRMIGPQLHSCMMPPADQPQLTADERQILLGWLACGGMNN